MPLLTLFSSPKPFVNPHIATIQRNAIQSWLALGSEVEIVLLGDERGIADLCQDLNLKHVPEIKTNSLGTPLISSLFNTAREMNDSPLLAYVNTDIVLFNDFLESAKKVRQSLNKFLLVGQRWDMEITSLLDFREGWQDQLRMDCLQNGTLHKPMGSDYFIYPRECFKDIPDFAVGRAGWDNWMIYESRQQGWKTIDATGDIMIIHQNHDYAHLPNGQPHYRLPETDENVRLAGGRRTIFHLWDANFQLCNTKITRKRFTWKSLLREIEIFPLVKLHSFPLAEFFYLVFNPRQGYAFLRRKLGKAKK